MAKSRARSTLADWLRLELPVLDETLCTGCGLCVGACPVECLEMSQSLPWLPRPRDCISCGICVTVCPVSALRLESCPGE
jgi:NAD-dependent dihydropyrimidine dehydrogenase PreA subunit